MASRGETTNLAAGTIVVVVAGQWAKGTLVPIKVIIGGVVYILLLSFMNDGVPEIAKPFAFLVFISAIFIYAIPIFQGLGLLEGGPKGKGNSIKARRRRRRNGGAQSV